MTEPDCPERFRPDCELVYGEDGCPTPTPRQPDMTITPPPWDDSSTGEERLPATGAGQLGLYLVITASVLIAFGLMTLLAAAKDRDRNDQQR